MAEIVEVVMVCDGGRSKSGGGCNSSSSGTKPVVLLPYQQKKTYLHVLAQLYLDSEGGGQQLEVLQGACCLLQPLECDGWGEGHLPHHAALSTAIC